MHSQTSNVCRLFLELPTDCSELKFAKNAGWRLEESLNQDHKMVSRSSLKLHFQTLSEASLYLSALLVAITVSIFPNFNSDKQCKYLVCIYLEKVDFLKKF